MRLCKSTGRERSFHVQLKRLIVSLILPTHRTHPAPLMLCFIPGFDLIDDTMLCPTERNDLKEFYDSAKGREWTEDYNWMDPHTGHCEWYGITCNDANSTIKLELPGNGLSGTLTPHLSNLSSLEVLDLSNNDIKVRHATTQAICEISLDAFLFLNSNVFVILVSFNQGSIPTEIGLLSNLINLRLSYNEFTGNGTNFGTLQRLKLIHLHGNRLSASYQKCTWISKLRRMLPIMPLFQTVASRLTSTHRLYAQNVPCAVRLLHSLYPLILQYTHSPYIASVYVF